MIRSLRIENFALIDATTIDFKGGFTVITGETGSGKSILLNALNLILGERANFSVIGDRKDKSIVEAEIDISGFNLKPFFESHQLDYFDATIVRREIYKQGRSRAFINDVPVQLNILKQFMNGLIHIHSQYNTLELKDKDFQLRMLDILAGSLKQRNSFHTKYNALQSKKRALAKKEQIFGESSTQIDYNNFQLSELEALNLDATDYERMQSDLSKFENADELRAAFGGLVEVLQSDGGTLDQLNQVAAMLQKHVSMDDKLSEYYNRIESVLIELKDISAEAEHQTEQISVDPEQLVQLTGAIDAYNKAIHKHRVNSQKELMELRDELSGQATGLDDLQAEIEQLKSEIQTDEEILFQAGAALHELRLKAIPKIESTITKALRELKLENTVLEFRLAAHEQLLAFGTSTLEMYFSPNLGVDPVPIHQAASGGELSRVMLALQSLMSKRIQLKTILFDEIDTGVSGDVAQKIGVTLKEMGKGMQVIAITHLPQVAAKGLQHLFVSKSIVDGRTMSSVKDLNMEERISETARLMSGDQINDAALENAKALMT